MFLASLSGGLVALGLMATATHVGTAFYAFGLLLLPTLAVLGLVTFQRTLQSGIEDYGYARRIASPMWPTTSTMHLSSSPIWRAWGSPTDSESRD